MNQQNIHYPHGDLHLYDYGHELEKKCWERSGGIPLIDQIRTVFNEERFPLVVAEGHSKRGLPSLTFGSGGHHDSPAAANDRGHEPAQSRTPDSSSLQREGREVCKTLREVAR
jgi:hypothetical protein